MRGDHGPKKILYVRRRKRDRPTCPLCGRGYIAGSTQGRVTYYYPACRCVAAGRKVIRQIVIQIKGGAR